MMVTFVSQCEKKALNRTRRVLDTFADRIGDNAWQTVITQEGLLAVKKLLRKTASKNTAVSCHWHRSRSRSDLVWVVGNKLKFNERGGVPVNSTAKDLLHSDWEKGWHQAHSIQILSVLAALLHDIGKATVGFQRKLEKTASIKMGDPYRHEWISLHLFVAMIAGCTSNEDCLKRLANFSEYMEEVPGWMDRLGDDKSNTKLHRFPPIAQLLAWLIVTHHRLPFYSKSYNKAETRKELRAESYYINSSIDDFYEDLCPADYWVKNPIDFDDRKDQQDFWCLQGPIFSSVTWQKELSRWANKALKHQPLLALGAGPISDPFIMHLARLCLMVGDHNFSSLSLELSNNVVKGDRTLGATLLANTDRETRDPKQRLDQHLLGVAKYTARFSRLLPQLSQHLPAIDKLKAKTFTQRTSIKRFQWQNRAADLATKLQQASQIQGFFGVNMASTGCGKTLANARIMYGLADPKVGARFTIALGLRILTLQTGQALREKLSLDEDSLAILVGSQASRKLFELDQAGKEDEANDLEQVGSESLESLVDETITFGDSGFDDAILGTVIENPKARDLLFTPIISCTIDHIIGASENTRGGKHIAPMLRLLSSDLILDEPDDFSQSDMPALSRLVHLAGMYGSRVLLSSATLTPDITAGLFMAYQAGRNIWNAQLGLGKVNVTCAWFDEYGQANSDCSGVIAFNSEHEKFIQKRAAKLRKEPAHRIAEVMPVDLPRPPENQQVHYPALAAILVNEVQALHQRHHEAAQNSNQTASIGLIRCANIKPLVSLAKQLYSFDNELEDTQIHLCCYHARQLLVLRNGLEKKLDRLLQRSGEQSLFEHPEIADRLNSSDKQHHIFVVLATAVAEVGRDHDYDWAIVEPSSLRSIIQLAGRVRRHRPAMKTNQANIKIMSTNIKALSHGANLGVGHAVFDRPGFEEDSANSEFLLNTHSVDFLISQKQLSIVNAIPRITRQKELKPSSSLVDLEHGVLAKLLNNPQRNFVNAFWTPGNGNHAGAHLQKISPFREQTSQQTDYVCLPDTTSESGYSFVVEEHAWKTGVAGATVNSEIRYVDYTPESYSVKPWLTEDFSTALAELGNQLGESNLNRVALRYAIVRLDDRQMGWSFHPLLGFWIGD